MYDIYMGRPTKYTPELLKEAEAYINTFDTAIPTIEGLALHLNISRETVYDWIDQENKKEFSDIVKNILAKQSSLLIDNGLRGKFNPTITKLLLYKHNYTEKSEVEHSGSLTIVTTKYESKNTPQLPT